MQKLLAIVSLALAAQGALGVAVWGQCGGTGYSGSTVCDAGSTCVYLNQYYSQCQPGASTSSTSTDSTTSASTTTIVTTTTSSTSTASTTSTTATATTVAPPAGPTPAQGYNQLTNFGSNPNNVGIYVYKPKAVANPPALIVAMHYCTGTAQAYYSGTKYATLSEQKGFYVIYPNSPRSGGCWDVASTATLTHDGGSDSLGIVNAVRYAIAHWGVDPNQVYATGTSSGAMMTSVLMGAYPDIFKAGAVDSGEPYGCFAGSSDWNSACANGQLTKTAQQWGDQVRSGYPGYTGDRPKVQIWHGTADSTLSVQTGYYEAVKQWTNVFGYSQTPISTGSISGLPSTYTNSTYGPMFQAILAQGVGHTVPVYETNILAFFGL